MKKIIYTLCLLSFFMACKTGGSGSEQAIESKKAGDNTVTLHELADPDMINPLVSSSANSTYINLNVFQQLLNIDFETLEMEGTLAKSRPEIKELTEGPFKGGMSLTYEIRPEAVWDNGKPITADDYIFTVKAVKNPKVNAANIRPYMEFIKKVEKDPANPKKFTVYSDEKYILAEAFSAWYILPEYIYDPKGLMRKYSIADLNDKNKLDKISTEKNMTEFADAINSSKFAREKGYVVGSGPYLFEGWETGQRITLKRKDNWWGDQVKGLPQLNALPEKLTYEIKNDWTTAITDMKDEGMDVARGINPRDYTDLKDNGRFNQLFKLHTPVSLSYSYLGINRKNPILADKKVRRAIAHLVDVDEIIETLLYGLGEQVVGPIHPSSPNYNRNLKPIKYDPEKAVALLNEAGWEDSDGNGYLDKDINGQNTELKLNFKYNNGNDVRKNIGILLKENAKRAGVNIDITGLEWTVFLEHTKNRDYDISCLGWVKSPIPDDMKQIWHTESDTRDGANRVGFGDEKSDRLIEQIRETLDEGERKKMYDEIQKIIYEDQPYVFLYAPKERIAIHSRFAAKASVNRPGYDEKNFELTLVGSKMTE